MSLHVFNNSQKLIRLISDNDLISTVQERELNKSDLFIAEIPKGIWRELEEKPFYMAVNDPYERFSYHMYKIIKEEENVDSVEIQGVNIAFDELKSYGYIEDRRFNHVPVSSAMSAIVDGTDWQVGYVDSDLPNVDTNFYYISRLEALSKLIDNVGGEVRFRVEVSGNRVVGKRIDIYKQLSKFKGKRFALGSNLIQVVKEEDTSELYTAMVGRGKGVESEDEEGDLTGGYGRKLTFSNKRWTKSLGDPVDKPAGQEFVEIPERTALYGHADGTPRTGFVEFSDIDDAGELLEATYQVLEKASRPKVQFKAVVETAGDMELGETVAIITPDFRYKTRVFKVKRDFLNNNYTEVEFGDKLTQTMGEVINRIDATIDRERDEITDYIQNAANGKNKIFRGPNKPTTGMMKGDLWYKPVANGEYELYQFDGDKWALIVHSGISKEIEKEIDSAKSIASGARSRANSAIADLEAGTSFYKHTDSIGLTYKNPDGTKDSIINVDSKGAYIGGKNVVLDGDTIVDGTFTVTNTMIADSISASKIKFGTLNGYDVNIVNMNAENIATGTLSGIEVEGLYGHIGDWILERGVLYSPLINGTHTTLKATGNVALATDVKDPFSTTGAGLQIWHDGQIRWNYGEGLIWPGVTSGLVIESKNYIHLRPSASVEVDGRVIPRYSGQGTLGADDKRWYRSYVTVAESVVSDARLKANIKDIPDELIEMLMSLRVKSYEIEGKKHFGYIAQDVERVLYKYAVNKVGHENASDYVKEFDMLGKTESYLSLVYTEIATLKAEEAQRRIETLEQRLEALENGE